MFPCVGALISLKHSLFKWQENMELICESAIGPWRAKARPGELRSSGVSTNAFYRKPEALSPSGNVNPSRKAKFRDAVSKFGLRSGSGVKLPSDGHDWQGFTLWGHLLDGTWHAVRMSHCKSEQHYSSKSSWTEVTFVLHHAVCLTDSLSVAVLHAKLICSLSLVDRCF